MNFKKIIFSFLGLLFFIPQVWAECKYQAEINRCIEANKTTWARSIEDFICANTTDQEKIAYQIIFDLKLKQIDKEAENFLKQLQNSPWYYFWAQKKESYIEWINYINEFFSKYWVLWNRYKKFCSPNEDGSVVKDYFECVKWEPKSTQIYNVSDYFPETTCMTIVEIKLQVYKNVAYDLLQLNKLTSLKEYRKLQLSSTRDKYDSVIQDMFINLDYMTRINNQRDKVTKQCQTISSDG